MRRVYAVLVLWAGCGGGQPNLAQQLALPSVVLQSPAPVKGGGFGTSLTFFGAAPVVGAPNEGGGIVYLFDPQTFGATVFQTPTAGAPGRYGAAIAANAVLLAIGEPGGANGNGRAYLYEAPTNALRLTFDSTNAELGGGFGSSIAVSQLNVAVGAPFEDVGTATDAGRVYYFDCTTDQPLQVLVSSKPTMDGHFGCAVAAFGFDVFVGACDEAQGSAYRFDGLSGALLNTYPHPDPQTGARFGFAMAASSTDIVIGAPGQAVGSTPGAGTVYVIDVATGGVRLTLVSPNPLPNDGFGSAVAVAGDRIFVGAPGAQQGAGTVWQFDGTSGALVATFGGAPPETGGIFGSALAAVGGELLVGAPAEDGGDLDSGRTYVNPPPQ